MWNPLSVLRRKVAEAFALGVQDGLDAACPDNPEPPATLPELRAAIAQKIAKSLPPAAPPEDNGDTKSEKPTAVRKHKEAGK